MYLMSYAIYAASWDLLNSYSGQLSLGHSLPFGLGSFVTLYLASLNIPVTISFLGGVAAAAVIAGSVGITTLRLKPSYQAIALLLFSQVLYWLIIVLFSDEGISLFSISFGIQIYYVVGFVLFALSMLAITLYLATGDRRMKLLALKGDNLAAEASGLHVARYKATVFYISSFFAGIAGAYVGVFTAHSDYSIFAVSQSFLPIAMVVIGGPGFLGGTLIGSAIVTALLIVLPVKYSFAITYLVYGITIWLILHVKPEGLLRVVATRFHLKE